MAKLLSVNKLPSKVAAGDVVFLTGTREFYISIADGSLLNLADLLSGAVPHTRAVGPQGPQGEKGTPGESGSAGARGEKGTSGNDGAQGPTGPRGADGLPGATGKEGRRGPKGDKGDKGETGAQGAAGPKGEKGDITFIGPKEAQQAVEKMRRRIRDYQARVQATIKEKIAGLGSHPAAKLAVLHLRSVEKVADNI